MGESVVGVLRRTLGRRPLWGEVAALNDPGGVGHLAASPECQEWIDADIRESVLSRFVWHGQRTLGVIPSLH